MTTPILALALAATAACTTSSDEAADNDGPCAWATRGDRETNNIAYPDAAATYWALTYDLADGETLEVDGEFPAARYASFITYGPYGGEVDVLTDTDIVADEDAYTVVVGGEEIAAQTNLMNATALEGSDAAERIDEARNDVGEASTVSDPGLENLLGGGGGEGTPGVLMYRVYVPESDDDPTGEVGLPDVTVVHDDGSREVIETCVDPGPNPRAVELTESYGPPTDRPAPPEPIFVRPEAGAANLFPNRDNVYIATIAEHRPGEVIVIRGKSPTFPDASQGRAVGSGEQVRYWSLCTNEYRKPYPVSHCIVDRDVILDDDDAYTMVISTPDERPDNATEDNGVTWLEWGPTDVNNLLLLRHMLADPSFTESAIHMEPGAVAVSAMGPYAPNAVYCAVEVVENEGPDACFD